MLSPVRLSVTRVDHTPGGPKNRGHFVLRPITLEILNISLPNLTQITVQGRRAIEVLEARAYPDSIAIVVKIVYKTELIITLCITLNYLVSFSFSRY